MNEIERRTWRAALPRALEELERTCGALSLQLKSIADMARQRKTPRPRASLKDILGDLDALVDEFPDVRWDLKAKSLSVVTEPVQLNDVALGRFEILLEYRNLGRTRPYRVIALDPHPAAGESGTPHPHVRHDDLCEGDGRAPIQLALRQGRFYDLFVLIDQILKTYNADSAYVPLSRWEGTACPDCGSVVSDDDTQGCEDCQSDACSECATTCASCHRSLCASCQDACRTCGDIFCRGCLSSCSGCSDDYCASCLEAGRCGDCQEIEADDENEAEDEIPAVPELQPVCLGQAPIPQGSGTD